MIRRPAPEIPDSAASSSPSATLASVLHRRQFFWFTAGQSISGFGDKLHSMALIGLIGAARPRSTAMVLAGLAVLYCVPFIFIAPVAGVLVDRWSGKHTLIACDATRALLVALIPVGYMASGSLLPLFALVAGVFGLALFFDVAKLAIVPDLVAKQELLAANAISNVTARIATLAGIVLGGMIVGWRLWQRLGWPGYAAGFYIDSLTFSISVATLFMLTGRRPTRRSQQDRSTDGRAPGQPGLWAGLSRDLHEISRVARRDAPIRIALVSAGLLGIVAGCMYVIVVVVLQTRTTWGTPGVGFVVGIMAGGIVVASVVVGQLGRGWRRDRMIVWGFAGIACLLVASARPFMFAWHGPLSFAGGLALAPIMIAQDTLLHESLPEEIRGRVFSLRDVILNVAFGLSAAATGVTVTALSRLGVEDPFRVTLLVVGPLVLLVALMNESPLRRGAA
jgi:MFS family permease